MSLVELEEYIKHKQTEKETLQHEIDEARAIIDSVNVDRQNIEDYKQLKSAMDKYSWVSSAHAAVRRLVLLGNRRPILTRLLVCHIVQI
jgi:uncharacterized protein YlxW (UPF0749 family)